MIWEGFRTPPKFGFELPGPEGPGFKDLDEKSEIWQGCGPHELEKYGLAELEISPACTAKYPSGSIAYQGAFCPKYQLNQMMATIALDF